MLWVSPVENDIGIAVFLLTEFWDDPLNSHSGIVDGSLVRESLFHIANVSSTKQWEEPESNNAMNGWGCSDTTVEVRESKKEFGESEVVLICNTCAVLPSSRQLFQSTESEKLPPSFPISWFPWSPPLPLFPCLEWAPHSIPNVQKGSCLPSGYLTHRLDITCFYVICQVLLGRVSHLFLAPACTVWEGAECFGKVWTGVEWRWGCGW